DLDVLAEIERLAAITGGWDTATTALDRSLRDHPDLTPEATRDLWIKIAGWRKDKMNDAAGAERAFEEALRHDETNDEILRSIEALQRVPGRERDLVATLRRIATHATPDTATEHRREAKALAEGALSDAELTEAILRDMIAADTGDTWALA